MKKNAFKLILMAYVLVSVLILTSLVSLADTRINDVTVKNLEEYGLDLLTIALDAEFAASDTVYVAVYNSENRLVDCISISDGKTKTTVSNNAASYVKVFAWNNTLTPSCSSFTQSKIN